MATNPQLVQTTNLLDPSIRVSDLTPEQVHDRILQYLGVEPPKVCIYLVLVALDVPKETETFKTVDGKTTNILMPETTADKMKYSSCTGMVVGMGPDAYVDVNRFPHGPSCRLGDWVSIPRHEGVQIRYRGRVMHWLPDDKVALVIDDPTYVVRG